MTSVLPDDALLLLPAEDESMRCAEFGRRIGVDPAGTSIAASAIVVVETPRPWPKPVFAHPLLEGLTSMTDLWCGPARVLAAEPRTADECTRVTVFQRDEVGMVTSVFDPPGHEELLELFDQLKDRAAAEVERYRSHDLAPELAVLVCTQGSHDICCGSDGVRFANDLEAAAPGLAVYRVSHTGGHRFAPTAMTLPDGRMWADMTTPDMTSILELTADAPTMASRCRGWWGAPGGAGQAAEVAVLRRVGWELDMLPRSIAVEDTPSGWSVAIEVARDMWHVDVERGRVVPTITCRAEGGLPAKPGYEYEVTSVRPPS
ncbi:MAG: sucrase ferredoxin [Actinomycetota bacterium]|nr:sucrase ferredoxin [Actinomycetota bacterium]